MEFLFKGGEKLAFALEHYKIDVTGMTGIDLGCNVGGFTDCLLKYGAEKVHSVDTGYGIIDWRLRIDERVTVHERTNALHWEHPEEGDVVVIDVGWTPQRLIIPKAYEMTKEGGIIVSLFKPQYEADKKVLKKGILPEEMVEELVDLKIAELTEMGYPPAGSTKSPIRGGSKRKGNIEFFLLFEKTE